MVILAQMVVWTLIMEQLTVMVMDAHGIIQEVKINVVTMMMMTLKLSRCAALANLVMKNYN